MTRFLLGLILGVILSFIVFYFVFEVHHDKWFKCKEREITKFRDLFNLSCKWISLMLDGGSVSKNVRELNYNNVCIYGMQVLGRLVWRDLESSGINVVCGMDRDANILFSDKQILLPGDKLEDVGVIIVTAVASYDEIKSSLELYYSVPIISLKSFVS